MSRLQVNCVNGLPPYPASLEAVSSRGGRSAVEEKHPHKAGDRDALVRRSRRLLGAETLTS